MLTTLQFSYVLLGIIMNLMSLLHFRATGTYYTPTRPGAGIAAMATYGICALLSMLDSQWPFRITMTVLMVILAGGGVIKHLATGSPGQYASTGTRWLAVLINGYGVVVTAFVLTVSFFEPGG
ncbi:hypothetical protein [Marinobacter confluentis]|uniref:Uncharacterized protein n=1 Tax=Marinobacter confluentis TaxID=1697557 RepID=A0A4Z1C2S3_9GAMM|nr:hypothetical protein [Marinobacter confluentis]TGN40451.1 hypothetical protein E5Q11_09290 [Marinobacter confluentis]